MNTELFDIDLKEKAFALLEEEKYEEAFATFCSIYHQTDNAEEKNLVFHILKEMYYAPNCEEQKNCYERNQKQLKQYPYIFGMEEKEFEQLGIELYPVSDSVVYGYEKATRKFTKSYTIQTERVENYLFSELSKPLFLEDLINGYELQFLNDMVRKSEDYGADNHIYLYYSSYEQFSIVLRTTILESLLKQEKFVFLIGEQQRNQYPIDFTKEFGIVYTEGGNPIEIDELKKICYWYKHIYSGTVFGLGVLGESSYIQVEQGVYFNQDSKIDGRPMFTEESFRTMLKDTSTKYSIQQLKQYDEDPKYEIAVKDYTDYLEWLEKRYTKAGMFTIPQYFRAYALFHYEQRGINPRIIPTILYDPHMYECNVYNEIIMSFSYKTVLTSMREPIITFARSYDYGLVVWNQFATQYILASDYAHTAFLPKELYDYYYGYRFEDLKQYPVETLIEICKVLNVPYEEKMLKAEAPMNDERCEDVKGFDQRALHRKSDHVFSDFDKMRLQIFYEPILKYYGYPSFDLEEYPLSVEEVKKLFSYRFRFEKCYRERYKDIVPEEHELHHWIQNTLCTSYEKYRSGSKIQFPKLIRPKIEEEKNG